MTYVIFETSTLADVLKKAARIAPTSGKELDQAAGMYFEVRPNEETPISIRVTNMQVFYTEWVNCLEISGDAVDWRIPSNFLNSLVSKFPIGTGKTVKLEQVGKELRITAQRTSATVGLIDNTYFPVWEPFTTSDMKEVDALGARITQVSWAVSRDSIPMTGLHFTGDSLVATDRYKMVTVPCEVPIGDEPITVPASILGPLVREMGDTLVKVQGNFLCLAPNDTTQIKVIIFAEPYPPVERVMNRDYPDMVMFETKPVIDIVNRIRAIAGTDRLAGMSLFIGDGELAFYMETEGKTQSIEDAIEVGGQCEHEVMEVLVSADSLASAMSEGPNDQAILYYNQKNKKAFLYLDGGSGYEVWIAPRSKVVKKESDDA